MTVSELIAELQKLRGDLPVRLCPFEADVFAVPQVALTERAVSSTKRETICLLEPVE